MKALKKTKRFILDTLFPIHCLNCGRPDAWLCESCLEQIKPLPFQVCPKCENIMTEGGKVCRWCKKDYPLKALVVATKYQEKNISKLVHLYKYNFIAGLNIPLGKIIIRSLIKNNIIIPDVIIPVPLHPRRLRWRGFNQSQLLAEFIAENLMPGLKIPVANDLLFRKKYTPPQMTIKNYAERRKNLSEIFGIENPALIKGKKILLVDDVATTGTTLEECARILRQNDARVFGAVIARQEFKSDF